MLILVLCEDTKMLKCFCFLPSKRWLYYRKNKFIKNNYNETECRLEVQEANLVDLPPWLECQTLYSIEQPWMTRSSGVRATVTSSKSRPASLPRDSKLCQTIYTSNQNTYLAWCDIVIYNRKCISGLCPLSWHRVPKTIGIC